MSQLINNNIKAKVVVKESMSSVSSPSPANVEDEDDWEETLMYVDLDDIPSVEELFAVEPDDFLLSQSKKDREVEEHKSKKLLRPSLTLKFFNLDDKNPVLQIGDRYIECFSFGGISEASGLIPFTVF